MKYFITTLLLAINSFLSISQNVDLDMIDSKTSKLLRKEFNNKNIICLGEFEHGWENIIETKCGIVKFLFDTLGYRNIIFEGSFIDGFMEEKEIYQEKRWNKNTQFDAWASPSVFKLISYLKQTYPEMSYYGCDIQDLPTQQFSSYLANFIKPVSSSLAEDAQKKDSLCSYLFKEIDFRPKKEAANIEVFFQKLLNTILINRDKLKTQNSDYEIVVQCIKNRIWLCKALQTKYYSGFFKSRDLYNGANIEWILNQYENKSSNTKTIIWAADAHIDKKLSWSNSMIEVLPEEIKQQIYAISILNAKNTYTPYQCVNKLKYNKKINTKSFDAVISVSDKKKLIIHKN